MVSPALYVAYLALPAPTPRSHASVPAQVHAANVQREDAAAALELRKMQMERTHQQRAAGAVISRVRRARNAAEMREDGATARGAVSCVPQRVDTHEWRRLETAAR